ncbi:MAG: hypothetical protein AAGG51_08620 [Cyanobacteria bacterium P01_G01_bin.54]
MAANDTLLNLLLAEYSALKSEQAQRIGFRDNLLYATLGVFGAIVSFAVTDPDHYRALLLVPWVCLILGWTYIVNDQKISALGRYIRYTLTVRAQELTAQELISQERVQNESLEAVFGWETAHRSDPHRERRKLEQLVIDQVTFVISGIIALVSFWLLVPVAPPSLKILAGVELALLVILGIEMLIYADLARGR